MTDFMHQIVIFEKFENSNIEILENRPPNSAGRPPLCNAPETLSNQTFPTADTFGLRGFCNKKC